MNLNLMKLIKKDFLYFIIFIKSTINKKFSSNLSHKERLDDNTK
jgi:hypothetical protein